MQTRTEPDVRQVTAFIVLLAALACSRPAPERARSDAASASQGGGVTAVSSDSLPYGRGSLPRAALEVLFRQGFFSRYAIVATLNPFYLRGRFDADSIPDVTIQIKEPASGKRGIVIIHSTDSTIHVLGAGTSFGNGGDDFSWLWIWRVEPRSVLADAPVAGPEVLYVEKPESAGGYIWWNGRAYAWAQAGD